MQTMQSPDQTVWSSRKTPSRNALFFSSSKVNLLFCFCFLPGEVEIRNSSRFFFISLNRFYLSLIYPPPPPIRFSSCCTANDADPRLPAGNPGPGEPGSAAGRPRHLHGQVHWETVQPDGLLVHHDDRWEVFRGFRLQNGAKADCMSLPLQEESVSQWQYWAPSWEEWWCEGWNFLLAAPASCVRVLSWSACSPRCHCCSLAAPPRRSMGSFLLGNRHQHTNDRMSTPNRSPMFSNSSFSCFQLWFSGMQCQMSLSSRGI